MIPRAGRDGGAGHEGHHALSIAAMIFWGVAYVPSGLLVETWPPLSAAGARLALGGLLLLGVLLALGRPVSPGVGALTVGWLALTQTVLFYGATFWGIAHAGAGLSAVLANTDPLFVAILAGPVLGERLGGPPVGGPCGRPAGGGVRRLAGAAVAARSSRAPRWWWSAAPSPGASAPWWPRGACAACAPTRSRWRAGRWPSGAWCSRWRAPSPTRAPRRWARARPP